MSIASSFLKIDRANTHINELESVFSAYINKNPCKLFIDKNGSQNVVRFEITKKLPITIPLIIGDAIHNLRAALDHLACSLVERSGKSTQNVYFPFAKNGNDFRDAIKNKKIYKAGPDVVEIIQNEIKPYKTGNYPLWALHQLDIVDKHKLLIPLIDIVEVTNINAIDSNNNRLINCTAVVGGPNKAINIAAMCGEIKIQGNPKGSFNIFFGSGQVFEGEPVIPILNHLRQMVSGIVNRFEHFFVP